MSEDTPSYRTPSYLEAVQSQLPALQLLTEIGWEYLPPDECNRLRSGRLSTAILDPILTDFIRDNARYSFKGREHPFTENAIASAVQALKAFRATGALHQNEEVYDLLCLPYSVPQTVEGDTKSFDIDFIDWKRSENNRYHCTAEFKVERIGQRAHYIPDIVLFVNGIPVVVIECKRSSYSDEKKEPIDLAIGQLGDYQAKDGIPQVFLYSQLLIALARDKAEYGTTGTERKYWSTWREAGIDEEVRALIGRPVPTGSLLLGAPFQSNAREFLQLHGEGRELTEQDRTVYALCRPERLLRLIYQNILFDNGTKKIARYQQFFAVEDILKRVRGGDPGKDRAGGVVWHTQGSGKSLTMVMLAKALMLAPDIATPKVVLVTDRIDLDDQICGTFRACGLEPEQAGTGQELVKLLGDGKSHVVTTIINKFEAATKARNLRPATRDTFVLVDEGHRSNYSEMSARMRLVLKGACFIGFTGTPLAKGAKRNTFTQFGTLFEPPYTIATAVADKAVVPLLYEARHVPQTVNQGPIDSWFEKLTDGLSDEQRADLKRKYSSERQLNKAEQKVRMIAWDVTQHYTRGGFQGTGLKGQLVAPDKATALLYKKCFDEFGMVSTEILMSGPNVREGDHGEKEASAEEKRFWKQMMGRYGSEERYNKQLINAFKKGDEPEIIIVVDKLLTGFDAPCNAVLYLTRKLKGHTLLQAIARVNRLFEGKEHGLILDYTGVIEELDEAIDFYAELADYEGADLVDTVHMLADEAVKLPQRLSDVWELFPGLKGTTDPEAFLKVLRDQELRDRFYERFGLFARTLSLALASTRFLEETPETTIRQYKQDLKFFGNLRADAASRYQERIDFSEYEPKIQKLIDAHVDAEDVVELMEPINLFDQDERQAVLDHQGKTAEAKADMIASATQRVIEREMAKDPVFYQKFSRLIQSVLDDIYAGRLNALEGLPLLTDYAHKVATHTDDGVPKELAGYDMARRFFGVVRDAATQAASPTELARISKEIEERLRPHKIRDFRDNPDALNRMRQEIDDVFFEAKEAGLEIPLETQDRLIDQCIEITIANDD